MILINAIKKSVEKLHVIEQTRKLECLKKFLGCSRSIVHVPGPKKMSNEKKRKGPRGISFGNIVVGFFLADKTRAYKVHIGGHACR